MSNQRRESKFTSRLLFGFRDLENAGKQGLVERNSVWLTKRVRETYPFRKLLHRRSDYSSRQSPSLGQEDIRESSIAARQISDRLR